MKPLNENVVVSAEKVAASQDVCAYCMKKPVGGNPA